MPMGVLAMRASAGAALVALVGCAEAPSPRTPAPPIATASSSVLLPATQITATVSRGDGDTWTVDYAFAEPQRTMIFDRSEGDYRTKTWTALDRGAHVERLGGFDALVFDAPVSRARFRVVPWSEVPASDPIPWLRFRNGVFAIYTGQFGLLPVAGRDAAIALDGQLSRWHGAQPRVGVRIVSDQPMLGERGVARGAAESSSVGEGTYVLVGASAVSEGANARSVVDDGLPAWLRASFAADLAAMFDAHRALWGAALPTKPTVLLAFGGYDGTWTNKGNVMGSLLAMRVSGADYRTPNEDLRYSLRWFFAHETAHLFQFRTGKQIRSAADAWIIEGGADAAAYRVLERVGSIDRARREAEVARAYERCAWSLGQGPLREAQRRGQQKAHYDCGLVIAEVTERALPRGDLFAFWNRLLSDAAKPTFDADLYAKVLADEGVAADVVVALGAVPSAPPDRSGVALATAMVKSGLAPGFDGRGRPKVVDLAHR